MIISPIHPPTPSISTRTVLDAQRVTVVGRWIEAPDRDGLHRRIGGRVRVGHRRRLDGVSGEPSTLAVGIVVRQVPARRRQVVECAGECSVVWRHVGRGVRDDGLEGLGVEANDDNDGECMKCMYGSVLG